jgi:polysaccharide export outer membrane protein
VEISFVFSPEFNQTVSVQPDGFVTLQGVEQLYAEGMTLPQFREAIRGLYAGMLHDPEVTVILKDFNKPYFIAGGEVARPGKYELRGDATVTEAVAMAGGFNGQAKHSQVVLFRRKSDDTGTLGEDIHLKPGDLLFVPQNTIMDWQRRKWAPIASLVLRLGTGFRPVAKRHDGRIKESAISLQLTIPQPGCVRAERDHHPTAAFNC